MKTKIHAILVDLLENHESRSGQIFGGVLVGLILLSTASFFFEHTETFAAWQRGFRAFDAFVAGFFGVEYLLRVAISRKKMRFIFSPLGIIDLLVVVSFAAIHSNLLFLRGLRVLRILQVLKVLRYSEFLLTFLRSFRYYRSEFRILIVSFTIAWVMSGLGGYLLEHGKSSAFETLGDAMWWAFVSMTTVGYGDMVPVTAGGKILAIGVVVLGLAGIAVLTSIITKIFIDHFFGKRLHHCEQCQFPHHDHDAKFCKNCGHGLDTHALDHAEKILPHTHHH